MNESSNSDDFIFDIGNEVIVNGLVDGRPFNNDITVITKNRRGECSTNMDKNGTTQRYNYKGTLYEIVLNKKEEEDSYFNKWWVPKYNLTKVETKPGKIRWYKNGKLE